jgi:hypothetical protein
MGSKTKITFEDQDGIYSVEVNEDNLSFPDVLDKLIVPVFQAAGYHLNTIREYIDES